MTFVILFHLITLSVLCQNPHEVINNMILKLGKAKFAQCEIINTYTSGNDTSVSKISARIIYYADKKSSLKPRYFKMTQTNLKDSNEITHEIIQNRKLYTIKEKTREVIIDSLHQKEYIDYWFNLSDNLGSFFYGESLKYLDSIFQKKYTRKKENLKYMITIDSNCISRDCYHINYSYLSDIGGVGVEGSPDSIIEFKEMVFNYWINKNTYLPERFSYAFTMNNDIPYIIHDLQYTKLELNPLLLPSDLTFNQLDYKNYRIEKLTPKGYRTVQEAFFRAPDFKGITQNGDSIQLYNSYARLYLVDFWFANCYPCMQLKNFIEKNIMTQYDQNTIMIIGVNPIDKSFSDVNNTLKQKAPKYPYILSKETAKEYHLSIYPGLYLLNSKFEVIRSWNNFEPKHEKEILDLIKKNLK